ncbi:hypothetical protein CWI84_09575 [Idiomarina tyrosinivorans]|uniref:Uncharacterized protein n=1 Tax=Idiomarina tyrosinivorans TaxID=1445662 RepID=A0A432ZPK6_9GAMM|nr:hypothetical protein [Idiomarina tyrosinivorans]RUO79865.1 hypothetical protein CWI84_09575 [Idiomarina tyrosinivorans]
MINRTDIEKESTFIAMTVEELPTRVKEILEKGILGSRKPDYLTALQRGPEWLFEYTRKYQPLTGNMLSDGKLVLYGRPAEKWDKTNPDDDYYLHFGLEINGFFVGVERNVLGKNPDDEGYRDFIERGNRKLTKTWGKPTVMEERHLSLPFELRQAYYSRFDGLNVPLTASQGIYTRLLPFPVGRPWESIDGYLGQLRLKKKLALIHEWFPDCQPKNKSDPYIKLMIFLDTRPTLSGKEGDVFFVKNHIQDGVIYYIRDGDIDNLMVLNEPVEAIDKYCHHILTRSEGRFDFMPYAGKFEG